MAETIKVRAVPGRVFGDVRRGPGAFVGLRRRKSSDKDSAVVHRVPIRRPDADDVEYVSAGVVEVKSTREIRRAIRNGALERVTDAKTQSKAAEKGGGGEG